MLSKDRRFRSAVVVGLALVLLAGACATAVSAQSDWARLQSDWALRDTWQRPTDVMDAMGAAPGSVVADVGTGFGYFAFRLAERVGPEGKVYAVDIRDSLLQQIHGYAEKQNLKQIETVLGAEDDPRLPAAALDGIVIVNTYHEMGRYDAMLQGMFRALKPGGKLVIIDQPAPTGKTREEYFRNHKLPEEIVRQDSSRNGFRFLEKKADIGNESREKWYFLVFEKPRPE